MNDIRFFGTTEYGPRGSGATPAKRLIINDEYGAGVTIPAAIVSNTGKTNLGTHVVNDRRYDRAELTLDATQP